VLLSHDQHADNLDEVGRALLPPAGAVVGFALRWAGQGVGVLWISGREHRRSAAALDLRLSDAAEGEHERGIRGVPALQGLPS
jgi:hypothetical protein